MKRLLFVLILVNCNFLLSAQIENLRYSQLTQFGGLPDNQVTSIFQDSKGFMWFGTNSRGLCRYDGYNFKVFSHNANDTNSLSSNLVSNIFEDESGQFWIITKSRVDKFDTGSERYTHFRVGDNNDWLVGSFLAKSGVLWLASWSGRIFNIDTKTGARSEITGDNRPMSKFSSNLALLREDDKEGLWIGTLDSGLYYFDIDNNYKLLQRYTYDPDNENSLSNNSIMSFYIDSTGIVWVGTFNGLNRITPSEHKDEPGKIVHFSPQPDNPNSLNDSTIFSIKEDNAGILWMRGATGINTYDRKTGTFKYWSHSYLLVNSLPRYFSSRSLCIDNTGAIYFTIYPQGVSRFSFHHNKFDFIAHDPQNVNSLNSNSGSYAYADTSAGVLWVGTWDEGLNKYVPGKKDGEPGQWHLLTHDPSDLNSLSSDHIRTIFRDSKGVLWVGTMNGGLNKLIDRGYGKERFEHFSLDSLGGGPINTVDIIHEDPSGNLWLGCSAGLCLFDRKAGKFLLYVADTSNRDSLHMTNINAIASDPDGTIWFGTWADGLFKVVPPFKKLGPYISGKTYSYRYQSDLSNELGDWEILSVHAPRQPGKDILWVGTAGGGLFRLQKEDKGNGNYQEHFKRYSFEDGLPETIVNGIEEDDNGYLWISMINNLSRFDPNTGIFNNYFEEDGLPEGEFAWLAHSRGSDGRMYYIKWGLLSFDPDSVYVNQNIPPVHITGISLFNKPLKVGDDSPLKSSVANTKEITLSYEQNFITLDFTALNYTKPEKNRYKYLLEGFDKDWVDAGTEHSVTYQGLQPGTYTFRVIASNSDGIWNMQGATLKIRIRPPWWKTIPAIMVYILLLVSIIYSFIKIRERKLSRDKKKLEEKIFERTEELHEVNTQLEEHHEELEQQKEELQQTLNYLKETQTQLVQSEKMASIGQLTAGIAHEINNPVNYINAGIESLEVNLTEISEILDLYDQITPENVGNKLKTIEELKRRLDYRELILEIRKLIGSIKAGSERTTEIVKGLRTFSRLDENEIKPADIHEGIDLTLVMLHNKYKHHIQVVKVYGKVPRVECFPGKLNQVFMNILSNAIDAIPEKGTITIKTWEDKPKGKVCISIKDDGIGMANDTLLNIFNPFFTTKDVGKGTGLGLSVSHGIIEQHKGDMKVESSPGEGAEFIISLPVKHIA